MIFVPLIYHPLLKNITKKIPSESTQPSTTLDNIMAYWSQLHCDKMPVFTYVKYFSVNWVYLVINHKKDEQPQGY